MSDPHRDLLEARNALRRLEIDISRRLDGLLQGNYQGLIPGLGSEAGEARPYEPGDDVRRIDWNVSARTNALHFRGTIADRELETWLVVDRSASLLFGTAHQTKSDLAQAAAMAFGLLTARHGNRLGGVALRPAGAQIVPAQSGQAHLMRVLSELGTDRTLRDGAIDLGAGLRQVAAITRRRGLVVVISDFLDPATQWGPALGALNARHQTIAVEIVDPRELELPAVGHLTIVDPESGRVREINSQSASLRTKYAAAAAQQRDSIAREIRSHGVDHLVLRTDEDWLTVVAAYVRDRRRLALHGAAPSRHT